MQYLLGQTGPEESSHFEERLITDKDFYDELIIAEDELVDQYLEGDLNPLEREQFESHFLFNPERRQKMRFGRALHRAAKTDEDQAVETIDGHARSLSKPLRMSRFPVHLPQSNAVLSYSVLVLLVFAGIGFWAIWRSFKQSDVRIAGKTATITLLPGATRADRPTNNSLSYSPYNERIQLRLALANPQETYHVRVVNSEEAEVWFGEGALQTDSGHSFIVAILPARLLPIGDYRVLLGRKLTDGSFEEVLGYSFRVVP